MGLKSGHRLRWFAPHSVGIEGHLVVTRRYKKGRANQRLAFFCLKPLSNVNSHRTWVASTTASRSGSSGVIHRLGLEQIEQDLRGESHKEPAVPTVDIDRGQRQDGALDVDGQRFSRAKR